jgi:hypothetical protein
MANKNVTNFKDLFVAVEKELQETLKNKNGSVAKKAVKKSEDHVQTDVYDVYEPIRYQRTNELKKSWEVQTLADGILITNTREEDGKDIAYIVHEADGYTQSFPYENIPRRFLDNAVEELKKTGELTDDFIVDLKKRGFKVTKM